MMEAIPLTRKSQKTQMSLQRSRDVHPQSCNDEEFVSDPKEELLEFVARGLELNQIQVS